MSWCFLCQIARGSSFRWYVRTRALGSCPADAPAQLAPAPVPAPAAAVAPVGADAYPASQWAPAGSAPLPMAGASAAYPSYNATHDAYSASYGYPAAATSAAPAPAAASSTAHGGYYAPYPPSSAPSAPSYSAHYDHYGTASAYPGPGVGSSASTGSHYGHHRPSGPPRRTPCKFYAPGNANRCLKGASCTFLHDDAAFYGGSSGQYAASSMPVPTHDPTPWRHRSGAR